jgi:hypothetical protein
MATRNMRGQNDLQKTSTKNNAKVTKTNEENCDWQCYLDRYPDL